MVTAQQRRGERGYHHYHSNIFINHDPGGSGIDILILRAVSGLRCLSGQRSPKTNSRLNRIAKLGVHAACQLARARPLLADGTRVIFT